jgi:hypothetical protein
MGSGTSKPGDEVMKKFVIRETETVKTTAAAYPIWMCWPW